MKNIKPLIKENIKTLHYIALMVFSKKKSYFVYFSLKILFTGIGPLINIILGKYLIFYLTLLDPRNFFIFAGLLVFINMIFGIGNHYCTKHMDLIHNDLQIFFEEEIGKKTIKLNYSDIETSAFQNQLEQAKVGISWYSGGIAGLAQNVISFCAGIVTLIGTLSVISQLSIVVIMVILISSIVTIIATAVSQKRDVKFRKRLVNVNRKLGYFLNIFKEHHIAKDVRLYQCDTLIESKVNNYLDTEWKLERNRTKFGNKIRVWIDVINYLNQSFLYGYFAYQMVKGIIDISAFTMFLGAGINFYNSIIIVTSQVVEIDKNASFMTYYVKFITLPERNSDADINNVLPKDVCSSTIEFQNVSFRYPQSEAYVLKNVNLTISTGKKVALIGPNGAGKTTLIKLLCRLYTPTSGRILLNGRNIREYNDEVYNQLISAVFQDYKTFAFSIRENLMASNEKSALDALCSVGLDQKLSSLPEGMDTPISKMFDESGTDFSGGELQRLAIARSMCKDAPIMILDEPTASLDPIAEYEIFRIFTKLVEDKTAFFISHRMASCLLCDQIVVLQDGSISAVGTHHELLADSILYKERWQAQAQYYQ